MIEEKEEYDTTLNTPNYKTLLRLIDIDGDNDYVWKTIKNDSDISNYHKEKKIVKIKNLIELKRKSEKVIREIEEVKIEQRNIYDEINKYLNVKIFCDIIYSYLFDIGGIKEIRTDDIDKFVNFTESNDNYAVSNNNSNGQFYYLSIFDHKLGRYIGTFEYYESHVCSTKLLKDNILFVIGVCAIEFWDLKTLKCLYGINYYEYGYRNILIDETNEIQICTLIYCDIYIYIDRFRKNYIDDTLVFTKLEPIISNKIQYSTNNFKLISNCQFIRTYHIKGESTDQSSGFELWYYNKDKNLICTNDYKNKGFDNFIDCEEGIYIIGFVKSENNTCISLVDKSKIVNEIIIDNNISEIEYIGNGKFICLFKKMKYDSNPGDLYIINAVTGEKELYLGKTQYLISTKLHNGQIAIATNNNDISFYDKFKCHISKSVSMNGHIISLNLKNNQIICVTMSNFLNEQFLNEQFLNE